MQLLNVANQVEQIDASSFPDNSGNDLSEFVPLEASQDSKYMPRDIFRRLHHTLHKKVGNILGWKLSLTIFLHSVLNFAVSLFNNAVYRLNKDLLYDKVRMKFFFYRALMIFLTVLFLSIFM